MSTIEKWRWRALVLTGLNSCLLFWLWLPKSVGWPKFDLTLQVLSAVTLAFCFSLVVPFVLASTYHWQAWQVLGHWSIAWFAYGLLAVLGPAVLKVPTKSVISFGVLMSFVGILCMDAPMNGAVGVRITWTFESPVIWRKVNRLAGWLFFTGGELSLIFGGWLPAATSFILPMMLCLLAIMIAVGYAYVLAHRPNHLV